MRCLTTPIRHSRAGGNPDKHYHEDRSCARNSPLPVIPAEAGTQASLKAKTLAVLAMNLKSVRALFLLPDYHRVLETARCLGPGLPRKGTSKWSRRDDTFG